MPMTRAAAWAAGAAGAAGASLGFGALGVELHAKTPEHRVSVHHRMRRVWAGCVRVSKDDATLCIRHQDAQACNAP